MLGTQGLGEEPEELSIEPKDIFLNADNVPDALSKVLTDSNLQSQKAKQLAVGEVPTLLAIRSYELIPRIEYLFTIKSAESLANEISPEAWEKLPDKCADILLCL